MPLTSRPAASPLVAVALWRADGDGVAPAQDVVAAEEPLEIQLNHCRDGVRRNQPVAVTMRTPGRDRELAVGFLLTEGVLTQPDEVEAVTTDGGPGGAQIRVRLRDDVAVDLRPFQRQGTVSSACGACGKLDADTLAAAPRFPLGPGPRLELRSLQAFAGQLRAHQRVFDQTGGLHAAALFDVAGTLQAIEEDVGRHNAVDKVIGGRFLAGALPLREEILFVSGRASFELVQKARMAGIAVLAAVGAPSSLAVSVAREAGMTLIGFVRDGRCNVYSGFERIPDVIAAIDGGSIPSGAVWR